MLRTLDMLAFAGVFALAFDIFQERASAAARSRAAGIAVERDVTEEYARRVAAMEDAVSRNLLITQAYSDLSIRVADALASGSAINWCTMAAWASRRAGQTIRMEDLPGQQILARAIASVPGTRKLAEALQDVSHQIGEGNREVFAEVGPAFAGFLAAMDAGPGAFETYFARFAPGPPERGGQDLLRRGFEFYLEASRLPLGKRKAELIYAANLHVNLHEQTRLQHRIAAAMPGGPTARTLVTRAMLAIELGNGTAVHWLGEDLPNVPFTEHLQTLEDAELVALVRRFDDHLDSTRGSGAARWDSLSDRMGFAVDLFRLHASDESLFEEPISAAEWRALTGRHRPPRF